MKIFQIIIYFVSGFLFVPFLIIAITTIRNMKEQKRLYKFYTQMKQELLFMKGLIDIPEEEILNKYLNAIIFYEVRITDSGYEYKVFDISNFDKNQSIGITYFVQEQSFNEFRKNFETDALMEKLAQEFDEDEDAEIDRDLVERITNNFVKTDSIISIMPHCSVYQLKDGRWLWREEVE